ncbi:hypothetical protein [Rossellomorea marisflavi]
MIDEKIYLDLEIHVINKRLILSEKKGTKGYSKHLESIIKEKIEDRKRVSEFLRKNGIKVDDPIPEDEHFVEYHYSCKVDGGYKEGTMKYWKHALRYSLKKRLGKYFATRE